MAENIMALYNREFSKNSQKLHSKNKECGYKYCKSFFEKFSKSNSYKKANVEI